MRTEGTTKVREALRDYLKALKTGNVRQCAAYIFMQSSFSKRWVTHWQVLGGFFFFFFFVLSDCHQLR